MIIHLYCIRVFIYICYDEFLWGKNMRRGGGVLRKKIEGGGYAGEGKEDKIRGGGRGVAKKKMRGGGYSGEG